MRLIKIMLFVFFLTQGVNAQDILKPYTNFLPEILQNNEKIQAREAEKIEAFFKVNPRLAAVHLQFLKLFFDRRIANPDSNLQVFEKDLLAGSKKQRALWAAAALKDARIDSLPPDTLSKVVKYFSAFDYPGFASDETRVPERFNHQQADYVEFLYFSHDRHSHYNSGTDYSGLLQNAIQQKISYFERIYKNLEQGAISVGMRDKYIQQALVYPYLFAHTYLKEYAGNTTTFSLLDFILKAFKQKKASRTWTTKTHFFHNLSVGLTINLVHSVSRAVNITDPFGFHYEQAMIIFGIFNFSITREIQLKTGRSFLSSGFVTLRLGGYNLPVAKTDKEIWKGVRAIPGIGVYGVYHVDAFKNVHYYNADLQATALLYSNGKLSVDTGVNIRYRHITYSYRFYVDGSVIIYRPANVDASLYDKTPRTETIKGFIVNPVLGFNYRIGPRYQVHLSALIPSVLLAGFSYQL